MSKQSKVMTALPPEVQRALRRLGENLALARKRRREPQRAWAQRIGVSLPTLIRLEKGDPGVAMGTYATAVWLMGRANALPDLADPALDRGALEMNLREARKRSVRAPASIERRLGALVGRAATSGAASVSPSPPTAKKTTAHAADRTAAPTATRTTAKQRSR